MSDANRRIVKTLALGPRTWKIWWSDGRSGVFSTGPGGEIWITQEGRTSLVEPRIASQAENTKIAAASEAGIVRSPVAGRLIWRSESVEVEAGDAMVIVESMKMQLTVRADVKGRVDLSRWTVGQSVARGEILGLIAPSERTCQS